MSSDLRFYTQVVVLRRLPMIVAVFLILAGAAAYMALTLPPMFTSQARLLVEAPQIPDNLASSTVSTSAAEQLQVLQQRVSTRSNLIELARKHRVYPSIDEMTPDQIVDRMRGDLVMRTVAGRDQATIMTVTFTARSGEVAANVANEIVTGILDENVKLRTGAAGDTLAFFQQEVQRLGTALDEQSTKIIDFQNSNLNALPSGQAYRLSQQTALQERLAQARRELGQLDTQRQNLLNLFAATGTIGGQTQANSPEGQLAQVQAELNQARTVYSDTNPRVRMLEGQVARLEEQVTRMKGEARSEASEAGSGEAGQPGDAAPAAARGPETTGNPLLDVQLSELDSRRQYLQQLIPEIEAQMADLARSIDATPANSIVLDGMQRDYENIQAQYNAARASLAQAATGERIELSAKGQRITVIEQATAPTEPTSPNRKKIAAAGVGAGLAAAVGLVGLLEMLNSRLRRPADLTSKLNIIPLATIPYIAAPGETARTASWTLAKIGAVAVLVFGALYLVHTQYMPLDLVMDKVRTRMGL